MGTVSASPFKDPNVIAALRERPASDVAVLCCPCCGWWGYYNQGSHFTCRNPKCGALLDGDALEAAIDAGEVMMLSDYEEAPDGP